MEPENTPGKGTSSSNSPFSGSMLNFGGVFELPPPRQQLLGGSSQLVSGWQPPFRSHKKAIWKRSHNPILRGTYQTWLFNHLLSGMILPSTQPTSTNPLPKCNPFCQDTKPKALAQCEVCGWHPGTPRRPRRP